MFTLQTTDYSSFESNGLELIQHKYYKKDSQFDLSVDATETKTGIELVIEYSTELFKTETINRLAGYYVNFLADAVVHADKRLSDITFMEEHEIQLLLNGFNSKNMVIDQPRVFHKAFEKQVEQRLEQAALIFKGQYMSYRKLNEKANKLACFLKEKGVSNGVRVGIILDRSFELYVAIFAVLKAGGAFIPIAAKTPKERVAYYLEDSQAGFVITNNEYAAFLDCTAQLILIDSLSLNGYSINNPDYDVSPDDLMYQIYTSGTTGQPKGVMVTHGQLTGIGYAWQKEYGLSEFSVSLLQLANISFDVFVGDLARTFLNGGRLVICPEEVRLDLQELYRLIQKEKVNIFESTPQLVIPLMDYINERGLTLDYLKVLLIGSDIFKIEDYRRLLKIYGHQMRIINSYGVTEATIDSTYFESALEELEDTLSGNVPIGKPFPNVRCIVVDSNMNLRPIGVPGELLIGGIGVSNGYWKRESLNKERFFHSDILGGKWYRTGDLAIWNSAGYLEFVGRNDRQIKIRGYRVELSEIENVLIAHPDIREAIVTYINNDSGGYLYGYIVEKNPVDSVTLVSYLSERLPEYMVPSGFMRLDTLPLTAIGKIDFKGLPHPVMGKRPKRKVTGPRSPTEKELFQIWKAVLETEDISIHDNFFDIGGNSVLILKLFNHIQNQVTMDISVPDLFSYPTVFLLAQYIEKSSPAAQEKGKRAEIEDLLDRIENESIDIELAKKILMDI
jgi:amino acid adenylation domain-containing protein